MTTGGGDVVVADEGWLNGRTALATTVRALGRAGYRPHVTVIGRRSLASTSRWCAGTIQVPTDRAGWTAAVKTAGERALLTVPASDSAIALLGLSGATLADKRAARERALAAGLPVPPEQEFADSRALLAHADDLPYPLIVKPAVRTGLHRSETARVDHAGELHAVTLDQPLIVQPYLTGGIKSVGVLMVDGELVAAVHQRYLREWPPGRGAACAAVTVEPDLELEHRVLELLKGHDGIAEVEFIGDYMIDVNPRVYGSMPLAVRAGANSPALWCASVEGGLSDGPPVRARPGVRYRWTDADMRFILSQVRSRQMRIRDGLAALAPRRDTAHRTQHTAHSAQHTASRSGVTSSHSGCASPNEVEVRNAQRRSSGRAVISSWAARSCGGRCARVDHLACGYGCLTEKEDV